MTLSRAPTGMLWNTVFLNDTVLQILEKLLKKICSF